MYEIIVFLGPSMSLKEAQEILPYAHYLPPVRCGDVLRALRLKPKVIAIIDGYFENTAAVWHKEILYAIEKNINVFGASSMGALRAAELSNQGMIGIGKVFENYHKQVLIDDDEVAVLHSPEKYNYVTLTDAMVNIRATLFSAVDKKIVDEDFAKNFCSIAKQLNYRERTLEKIFILAKNEGLSQNDLNRLQEWLNNGNYINQKHLDAEELLHYLNNIKVCEKTLSPKFSLPRSAFFNALHRNVMCRPFSSYQSWLPQQEKVALASRLLGEYQLTRRLAYLMAATYDLSQQNNINPSLEEQQSALNNIFKHPFNVDAWCRQHDCTLNEYHDFMKRTACIYLLLEKNGLTFNEDEKLHSRLLFFMRLFNDYQKYKALVKLESFQNEPQPEQVLRLFQRENPQKFRIVEFIALLWLLIERRGIDEGLHPTVQQIQNYSDKFRKKNGLLTQHETEEWLQNNDLDFQSYWQLIISATQFSFLVLQNNLGILNIKPANEDVWWLLDALRLTDVYSDAKDLLKNPSKIDEIHNQLIKPQTNLAQLAYSLDFLGG